MKQTILIYLAIAMILSILAIGCEGELDLSAVKLSLLEDPAIESFTLSHDVCPRCGQKSSLDGGIFYPFAISGSVRNSISYQENILSRRFRLNVNAIYCRNCGLSKVDFGANILSLAELMENVR